MTLFRERNRPHQRDVLRERWLAELRGAGGDTESRLHHWLVSLERHHFTLGDLDGSIRAAATEARRQVRQTVLQQAARSRILSTLHVF